MCPTIATLLVLIALGLGAAGLTERAPWWCQSAAIICLAVAALLVLRHVRVT